MLYSTMNELHERAWQLILDYAGPELQFTKEDKAAIMAAWDVEHAANVLYPITRHARAVALGGMLFFGPRLDETLPSLAETSRDDAEYVITKARNVYNWLAEHMPDTVPRPYRGKLHLQDSLQIWTAERDCLLLNGVYRHPPPPPADINKLRGMGNTFFKFSFADD